MHRLMLCSTALYETAGGFMGPEALRNWIRQDEADRGERADRLTTEEREIVRQLRRENEELKRVNEILRLASSFSPRNSTRPGDGRDVRA
jgi:transposase